jgi:glycosyltransferase involved in cell wall biosynthesis
MPKLSLVIPCYNEERTLAGCLEKVLGLKKHGIDLDLLIVDDCSTDASLEIARNLAAEHPEITVLRHDRNMGKGAALRTGFLQASGDYVGVQDADNEYDPLDYLTLLKPLEDGRADAVFGSRYLRPDTRKVLYFWHTQMNRLLTFFSNMFTDLGITDMETGYKLFRREIIREITPKLKEKRFGFEPEVTALVAETRCRVYECAIAYNPRTFEEGKKIGWKDGVRAAYCIMHYGACRAPLPMQLLIYFFIGLTCALANIAMFSLLFGPLPLAGATAASFLLAAALNYVLCILILFRHRDRWSTRGELFAYCITLGIMGFVDYGCTAGLIAVGISALWAKVLAAAVGFAGNFLLRKYLVF